MNLSIFRRRATSRHATPQHHPVTVPVNVTPDVREAGPISAGRDPNAPMEYDLTGAHAVAGYIRDNLQTNPLMPVSRALLILRAHRDHTLAGITPPPHERQNIVDAVDSLTGHFMSWRAS